MGVLIDGFLFEPGNGGWNLVGCEDAGRHVVVPSHADGQPVVLVAVRAFEGNATIESLEVPDTVTFIGNQAFEGCASLRRAVLHASVSMLNFGTFQNCTSLEEVVLPPLLATIGDGVFHGCTSLASIDIPNGVTTIGDRAFAGCTSLTTVVLPPSVTTVMRGAFRDCSSLSTVVLPDTIIAIGPRVFQECPMLSHVAIEGDNIQGVVEAFLNNHSMGYLVTDYVLALGRMSFEDGRKLLNSKDVNEQLFGARIAARFPERLNSIPSKQKMARTLAEAGCTEELRVLEQAGGFLVEKCVRDCIELSTAAGHVETTAYLLDVLSSLTSSASADTADRLKF